MDRKKVRIVVDSSSDILELDGYDFASAPLKIITDVKEYVDDQRLNVEEMVEELLKYSGRSSTSCPNMTDWLGVFGDAEYVFCITITAALSGSYNSARVAKRIYEDEHEGRRVCVINSRSTGPEMRLIVEKLCEYIDGMDAFDEVCSAIDDYMQKTGLLFMLQSMKNLANNGRVNKVVAKMAGVLGIRAIGRASDEGTLEMLEKSRGEKNTLDCMVLQMKNLGYNGGKVRIAHCMNGYAADGVRQRLKTEFENADIEICECRALCSFYAEKGGLLVGFEK